MNLVSTKHLAGSGEDKKIQPFPGFESITANYLYCPNQFFDICMKSNSRGMVRIVAYIMRQTIGWLDKNGMPINDQIKVSYRDLIEKAGVSRGAIAPALQRAVASGFIDCVVSPSPKSSGQTSQTAEYSIRWDDSETYQKNFEHFDGFYTGEGNRTPIPNAFFERIVPTEPLAVTKVVGTVLRNTVGHWTQFGGRKTEANLSYSRIQNYAHIKDRKSLAAAIRTSIESRYIERTQEGTFDHQSYRQSTAAYTVRWQDKAQSNKVGSKNPPASEQFKKTTSIGSKSPPADRFKKPTSNKTTNQKDILKQQNVAVGFKESVNGLLAEGFQSDAAEFIVRKMGVAVVERQLKWLDARKPRNNRIGLLRRAIEEDWDEPESHKAKMKVAEARKRDALKEQINRASEAKFSERKRVRIERNNRLLKIWEHAPLEDRKRWIEAAVLSEPTTIIQNIIRRKGFDNSKPHFQVLNTMQRELVERGVISTEFSSH